ncbi:LamG domain-containing protein [Aporhodopirellula aestuarii]|uniref:LamG domain-containing protein n=1 Tax=Aporhodopirellula aestuarii TaxID=2950107 RepID=A0ABT0UDA2_9BACT|nr:LamG domain-containing protein [Aporhodopirellula aestuarii]MCM2374766.1 LamG domain-containing protein [Aporhodopirellula aestuarii]
MSAEEGSAMESAMDENAEFQRLYCDAIRMHASLAWPRRWSITGSVTRVNSGETTGRRRDRKQIVLLAVVASVAASIMIATALHTQRPANDGRLSAVAANSDARINEPGLQIDSPARANFVGVLSNTANVAWKAEATRAVGTPLRPGWLRFDSGMIQVDFFGGARLIVRGPAEIQLRSSSEALLRSGEATCFVGELGRGFRLLTGESEVVDLGTSFGMRVVPNQRPEVHVFEGKIAIRQNPQSDPVELTEELAVRLDSKKLSPVEYAKKQFPGYQDLQNERASKSQQRYDTWKLNAAKLSLDPSVLVHYTFEDQQDGDIEVLNRAKSKSVGSSGAIMGATWGEGRWPSKTGLHYRDRNDRMLFKVPGKHDSITFLIWARVDALMGQRTALLLSEHPGRWILNGSMPGHELHEAIARHADAPAKMCRWTLETHGRPTLNLAFEGRIAESHQWDSYIAPPSVAKKSDWGRWSCLAVTYDTINKMVVHYHNGLPIHTTPLARPEPLLLQCMELGNLSVPTERPHSNVDYRFYGVIDEVLIAKRALTEREIAAIYETGNNAQ